jgi:biopolymer transport protein ExbD
MTIHKGIKVNLPVAGTAVANNKYDYYTVSINKSGALFFNKQEVDSEILKDKLTEIKKEKDVTVFIDADKEVAYKNVVTVLDLIKSLNIRKVSLSTAYKEK